MRRSGRNLKFGKDHGALGGVGGVDGSDVAAAALVAKRSPAAVAAGGHSLEASVARTSPRKESALR